MIRVDALPESPNNNLVDDTLQLAWAQTKEPIILKPIAPKLDLTGIKKDVPKPEPPKPEHPKLRFLTGDEFKSLKSEAEALRSWNERFVGALKSNDSAQVGELLNECKQTKLIEKGLKLESGIQNTVIPQSMPQLAEPWVAAGANVHVALKDLQAAVKATSPSDALPKATFALQRLDQALKDGFDRAAVLADRLPQSSDQSEGLSPLEKSFRAMSPEDQRKCNQIQILRAYQSMFYFVGMMEFAIADLNGHGFNYFDKSDVPHLQEYYKKFQHEMKALKDEFDPQVMKTLESSDQLTHSQAKDLKRFRETLESAWPDLNRLAENSPFLERKYQRVDDILAHKMSELQKLSWRICDKTNFLTTEFALKEQLKTAPDWKKPLLSQELVLRQYGPLAEDAIDVRGSVWMMAVAAEGKPYMKDVSKYKYSREHRDELVRDIKKFQDSMETYPLAQLEQAAKDPSLTKEQQQQLATFRKNVERAAADVEAIRSGVETGETIDLSAITPDCRARLDLLVDDRRAITDMNRDIIAAINDHQLKSSTPEAVKPLMNQAQAYKEMSHLYDALHEVERETQTVFWNSDSGYNRNLHVEEYGRDLLRSIKKFKKLYNDQHVKWYEMVHSNDLTGDQRTQLSNYYDGVQSMIPLIDRLETDVQAGVGRNFWRVSKTIREQMDIAHDQGFKITLAGWDLDSQLSKALKGSKRP